MMNNIIVTGALVALFAASAWAGSAGVGVPQPPVQTKAEVERRTSSSSGYRSSSVRHGSSHSRSHSWFGGK